MLIFTKETNYYITESVKGKYFLNIKVDAYDITKTIELSVL